MKMSSNAIYQKQKLLEEKMKFFSLNFESFAFNLNCYSYFNFHYYFL